MCRRLIFKLLNLTKMPNPIKFNKSTYKAVNKVRLSRDIITSENSVPEMRKEIRRVFQMANRRIQNIENAGVFSPALEALDLETGKETFSKFSISGKNWTEIKIAYSQAVEFLRKPTSTASGAKQFNETIRQQLDLTPAEYQRISKQFIKNEAPETAFFISSDIKQMSIQFENAVKDISEQLENAAQRLENITDLEAPIKNDLSRNYMDMPEDDLKAILGALDDFGV